MTLPKTTQWIVTANRLRDGAVVYLAPDGSWSRALHDAWGTETQAEADGRLAWARQQERVICDPYVFGVDVEHGRRRPRTARERIRAEGPRPTLVRLGYLASEAEQALRASAG